MDVEISAMSPVHPYRAGYRKPSWRQRFILVLSAVTGFAVAGTYLWLNTSPEVERVRGVAANRDFPSDENITVAIGCVLFFGAIYATGTALYRLVGDRVGSEVVSANAGQHVPLLLLLAGGMLCYRHGEKVLAQSGHAADWVQFSVGVLLLALSALGLFRATVVHREFYQRFYGVGKNRPAGKP
jgi:hypothetical protein